MNTKIALSSVSILASLAIVAGATFAFFSDSATSTGNTFNSGTLNLLVDDVNESPAPTITGSLSISNFAPGQSTSGFISLHNPGTIDIAEVEMTADTTPFSPDPDGSDIRNVLQLTVLLDDSTPDAACSGGVSRTDDIEAQVGDTFAPLTLAEFDNGSDVFDAFLTGTGLPASSTRNVCFTVTFDSAASNIYQGDTADTTFSFTANQNASQ